MLVKGDSLTDEQLAYAKAYGNAVLLGGEGAVSASIATQAAASLGSENVTRLSGDNRYETGLEIVKWEVEQGMLLDSCGIATGANFPDALTSGMMLAKRNSVLVLVEPTGAYNDNIVEYLGTNYKSIAGINYLGGTGAVPQAVRDTLEEAINPSAEDEL